MWRNIKENINKTMSLDSMGPSTASGIGLGGGGGAGGSGMVVGGIGGINSGGYGGGPLAVNNNGPRMIHSLSTPSGVDGSTTPHNRGGKKLAIRVQMLDDSVTFFQVQVCNSYLIFMTSIKHIYYQ